VFVLFGALKALKHIVGIGVVFVSLVAVRRRAGYGVMVGLKGSNNAAVFTEGGLLKQAEVMAGIVNGSGHQNGRAAIIVQSRLQAEVFNNAGDNALFAFLGAHQFFQRGPAFTQGRFLVVVQGFGFLFKPVINRLAGTEPLGYIAGFVFQIQHNFIGHGLRELVGMN